MKRGFVLMMVLVLSLMGNYHLHAGPRRAERPARFTSPAPPPPAKGITASEQVTRDEGEQLPHPEVTPEESERLLKRTEREDPQAVDNSPQSPLGLPRVPGRQTKIAPSPNDPTPPTL